jgi:hypothetical protein
VSIANSKSASDYEGYLSRYPNGTFADLARGRIEQLAQERAREEQAEADRQKAAADERARNEAIERDKAAAAAAMQRAEEDRKNLLPVVFKVRHNHSGFGSVFGGGSDCQGELQINKALKTVAYTTSTKDSFQAKCADLSKIGIKKDDNVDLMDFTVGKRRFTFASLSEGHTAKEIVDLISSTCGATP